MHHYTMRAATWIDFAITVEDWESSEQHLFWTIKYPANEQKNRIIDCTLSRALLISISSPQFVYEQISVGTYTTSTHRAPTGKELEVGMLLVMTVV